VLVLDYEMRTRKAGPYTRGGSAGAARPGRWGRRRRRRWTDPGAPL